MIDIPGGRYRHYKGNEYTVLGVARHSETLEEMVVYRPEYGERRLWVRPAAMFAETVEVNGRRVPRFEYLGSEPSAGETSAGNVLTPLPTSLPEELVEILVRRTNLRVERIVSLGHVSPPGFWYDQEEHEFVVLLTGAARLEFEEGERQLTPGSWVEIAPHRRHRVSWTDPQQPTIWLAVHYT